MQCTNVTTAVDNKGYQALNIAVAVLATFTHFKAENNVSTNQIARHQASQAAVFLTLLKGEEKRRNSSNDRNAYFAINSSQSMVDLLTLSDNFFATCLLDNGEEEGNVSNSIPCEWKQRLVPYVIRNGTVFKSRRRADHIERDTKSRRMRFFEKMLHLALDMAKQKVKDNNDHRFQQVIDGDFPFLLFRGDPGMVEYSKPIFVWAMPNDKQDRRHARSWPIPSYYLYYRSLETTERWEQKFEEWNKTYPWNAKQRVAFWRGSPRTIEGNLEAKKNWEDHPRTHLVQHSMEMPELIDAAFVGVPEELAHVEDAMRSKMRFEIGINETDFMKYAALIDLDGNSWSSRFSVLLCLNSVVIKVHPRDVDYFHEELQPWKHYVPVYANMSNLDDIVKHVLSPENSVEMRKVVKNANDWCKHKLTQEQLAKDFLLVLASYVETLRQGDPEWPKTWKATNTAYELPSLQMEPLFAFN